MTHAGIMMIDSRTTKEANFTLNDVNDMDFPIKFVFSFVDVRPLLAAMIAIMYFTILLLISLYMNYRWLTVDVICSCFIITTVAMFFMWQIVFFVNPTATLHRVLVVAISAVFLYMIRCLWRELKSGNWRLEEHV